MLKIKSIMLSIVVLKIKSIMLSIIMLKIKSTMLGIIIQFLLILSVTATHFEA
jgi:hypothetical protein